jgi:hypothetical protein
MRPFNGAVSTRFDEAGFVSTTVNPIELKRKV